MRKDERALLIKTMNELKKAIVSGNYGPNEQVKVVNIMIDFIKHDEMKMKLRGRRRSTNGI